MSAVIPSGAGRRLSLPGRTAVELVSGSEGGYGVTVRRVGIPPESLPVSKGTGDRAGGVRGPHRHDGCEEIILILSGRGEFITAEGSWSLGPGDVVVVSPGEPHRTRNIGREELVSMCFFPVPDLTAVSAELPGPGFQALARRPDEC